MIRKPWLFAVGQTILMIGAAITAAAMVKYPISAGDMPCKFFEDVVTGLVHGSIPLLVGLVLTGVSFFSSDNNAE